MNIEPQMLPEKRKELAMQLVHLLDVETNSNMKDDLHIRAMLFSSCLSALLLNGCPADYIDDVLDELRNEVYNNAKKLKEILKSGELC